MDLLGSASQACPNCGVVLARMPQKKTRCRDCKNYIYVRTRPQDRRRVLLREDQLAELERQWVIEAATRPRIRPRPAEALNHARAALSSVFGRLPSERDVLWRVLNDELLEATTSESWGLYTSTQFEVGELLMSETKYEAALHRYLTAFILDVNGPRNIDKELVRSGYARFSGQGPTPDIVVERINQMIDAIEPKLQDIKDLFQTIARDLQLTLLLPLPSEQAWNILCKAREERAT
jgi:hypothetical protein